MTSILSPLADGMLAVMRGHASAAPTKPSHATWKSLLDKETRWRNMCRRKISQELVRAGRKQVSSSWWPQVGPVVPGAGHLLVILRKDGEGHACGEVVFDCKNVLDCNE